jgi:hypothetical protein
MRSAASGSSDGTRAPQRSLGSVLFDALVAGASVNVARSSTRTFAHDSYSIHADEDVSAAGQRWQPLTKLQLRPPSTSAPNSRASSAYGRSTSRSQTRAHAVTADGGSEWQRPASGMSFFSASASRPASGMSTTSHRSGATTGSSSSAASSNSRSKYHSNTPAVFRSPILASAMASAGAASSAHALQPHGSEPSSAAIAAAFATLESLCDNPSLADLHAALRRCVRELSLGVYCRREWLGFNSGGQTVPFFEILKEAGQQVIQSRVAFGAERSITSELQQQVAAVGHTCHVTVTLDTGRCRTARACGRR